MTDLILLGFVVGILMFAFWWFSRKHLISIGSDGAASLDFGLQGMSDDKIEKFLFDVNSAKNQRMNYLYGQGRP